MLTKESTSMGLPDFPITNLKDVAKVLVSTISLVIVIKYILLLVYTCYTYSVLLFIFQFANFLISPCDRVM